MDIRADMGDGSGRSILGWLGLGRNRAAETADGTGTSLHEAARQSRRDLLDAISSFLLDNDLDISATNLAAAHAAFSGANRHLARQIGERLHSGEAVTQRWLDEVAAPDTKTSAHNDLDKLVANLESSVEAFSKTTQTARSATTHYNTTLERHVVDLEQVEEAGQIISSLAGLARTMLNNTRKVEEEMRRSEKESKALRNSLARARRDAEVDFLTGLPNRRAFNDLLDKQYNDARVAVEPLCVAICDIDNFKKINDDHGHDAGDRVLKTIAGSFAKVSNDKCHVARYGGEEFVMLFRGLGPAGAFARLDELRQQLADRRLVNRKSDKPFGQVTFSGGIADVFGYSNPNAALKAADDALYRAKQAGRNRIELA